MRNPTKEEIIERSFGELMTEKPGLCQILGVSVENARKLYSIAFAAGAVHGLDEAIEKFRAAVKRLDL